MRAGTWFLLAAALGFLAPSGSAQPLPGAAATDGKSVELLDFTAAWCQPCQQAAPVVERLVREGLPIRKVDVDRNRDLVRKFGVPTIPTFILVVDGKEVSRLSGPQTEASLRRLLAQADNARRSPDSPPAADAPRAAPSRTAGFALPFLGRGTKTPPPTPPPAPPVIRGNNGEQPLFTPDDLRDPPLASSVRIRVSDRSGTSFGSGTIIDHRDGRALVLTCGHVLRDIPPKGLLEIDVFAGKRVETFVGKPIGHDLDADVGLLEFRCDEPLPVSPVAPPDATLHAGLAVRSIGCSSGKPPTSEPVQVTALNRYAGPDNVECSGVPVRGRSGGGLFNSAGQVVGVCSAADPQEKRGLYAGLRAVHDLLTAHRLDAIRPPGTNTSPNPASALAAVSDDAFIEDGTDLGTEADDSEETGAAAVRETVVAAANALADASPARAAAPENAAERDRRLRARLAAAFAEAGDDEIVVVVRSNRESAGHGRVMVIRVTP